MNTALLRPPRCAKTLPSGTHHAQDSDRLLVLTLAVVLAQNHAPIELILALLYIVM